MISPHEFLPCLTAYDRGYGSILYEDAERRRRLESDDSLHHARARRVFGRAEESALAGDGRLTLSARMRREAGISDRALFVGVGGSFEIWSPEHALESDDPALRSILSSRLEAGQDEE